MFRNSTRRRHACHELLLGAWLLLGLAGPAPAQAQNLVADLTSHLIAITTSFTGTEVVLFGMVESGGDILVAVRGPDAPVTVRRKERTLGIWINRRAVTFPSVPDYYALAASAPLAAIARPETLAKLRIGVEHLGLTPAEPVEAETLNAFRAGLIELKQKAGLYPTQIAPVNFVGPKLFRATIGFPATVPVGTYQVHVYLLRDGAVVAAQTSPLRISKLGVSADVVDLADRQALIYGAACVVLAIAVGYLANLMFRRT